jgi:hypothetical protein
MFSVQARDCSVDGYFVSYTVKPSPTRVCLTRENKCEQLYSNAENSVIRGLPNALYYTKYSFAVEDANDGLASAYVFG